MSSTRDLKRRIKTAGNISKITKAMESVAASKMKKAQDAALSGVSYENLMKKMVANIIRFSSIIDHPLISVKDDRGFLPDLTILISPDRGLCGSLPAMTFRLAEKEIAGNSNQDKVIVVGKKAVVYAKRTNWNVLASFDSLGDRPTMSDASAISSIAIEEYEKKQIGRIRLLYPKFISTLNQEAVIEDVLPVKPVSETSDIRILQPKYIFEPTPQDLLSELLPAYVRISIYQSVLSSKAAEQSARMIAMKNASDNAREVKGLLQLSYNQTRQKAITAEIADIVTASMAVVN
ncbi:ATP synthase F1 subunit gamma [Candidatus Collierbacteria bacterium]|nr:ATP synthase F1 subunit gamma [Candidatus Collierbacteria bacterium]